MFKVNNKLIVNFEQVNANCVSCILSALMVTTSLELNVHISDLQLHLSITSTLMVNKL